MANALTLVDGLAVIGGGIATAWPLFLPALVAELNPVVSALFEIFLWGVSCRFYGA